MIKPILKIKAAQILENLEKLKKIEPTKKNIFIELKNISDNALNFSIIEILDSLKSLQERADNRTTRGLEEIICGLADSFQSFKI